MEGIISKVAHFNNDRYHTDKIPVTLQITLIITFTGKKFGDIWQKAAADLSLSISSGV